MKTNVTISAFDTADWDAVCEVYEPAAIQEISLSGADAKAFRPLPQEEDRLGNDPAISLYQEHGMEIVLSRPPEMTGYLYTELRMALPTSRKFDPNVPNFGV